MAMGVVKNNVILSHLNSEGDRIIDLPITSHENVDGLAERIEEVSALAFKGIDCGTLETSGIINEEVSG